MQNLTTFKQKSTTKQFHKNTQVLSPHNLTGPRISQGKNNTAATSVTIHNLFPEKEKQVMILGI
jgi:hypothetical protein